MTLPPHRPTEFFDRLGREGFPRRLARAIVGEDEAEDALQDAWVALLEGRGGTPVAPRAWFRRVLGNMRAKALSRDRNRWTREREVARDEAIESTDEIHERLELAAKIAGALDRLPEPFRTTLFLRTYEDLSPPEIARRQGVPLETVHSRLRRARHRLREDLERSLPGGITGWALPLLGLAGRAGQLPPLGPPSNQTTPTLAPTWGTVATTGGLLVSTKLAIVVALAGAAALLFLTLPDPGHPTPPQLVGPDPLTHASTTFEGSGGGGLDALPPPAAGEDSRRDASHDLDPSGTTPAGVLALAVTHPDRSPAAALHGRVVGGDGRERGFVLDHGGGALLDELRPGEVRVSLNGRGSWRGTVPEEGTGLLEIELTRGVLLLGTVVDQEDRPVPGAEVFLARGNPRAPHDVLARTDAGGHFRIRDLREYRSTGPYTTVAARADGFVASRAWKAVAQPGAEVELTLRLGPPGAGVEGLVLAPDGRPHPDARIEIRTGTERGSSSFVGDGGRRFEALPPHRTRTDSRGAFTCLNLVPGVSWITVTTDHCPPLTRSVTARERETKRIELRLDAGATLAGVVRDSSGAPIAGARVWATLQTSRTGRSARTGDDGAYRLVGLAGGPSRMGVSHEGHGELETTIDVPASGTVRRDLVLQAAERLEGRLVDGDGAPVAGYRVCLIRPNQPGLWIRDCRTTGDGTFTPSGSTGGKEGDRGAHPESLRRPALDHRSLARGPDPGPFEVVLTPDCMPTAGVHGEVVDAEGNRVLEAEVVLTLLERRWSKRLLPDSRDRSLSLRHPPARELRDSTCPPLGS